MNWPSLSVIIPSYNQGHYIERTILSILKQDYPGKLQVIVSDGGSNDSTVEVLKKYPAITWWSAPDKGFADAVNKALAVADGEIIAIQSSDDYYLKGTFETAIRVLLAKPDFGFVTGADYFLYGENPKPTPGVSQSKTLKNPDDLLMIGGINQHCTFIRRAAIDRVDGLRPNVDRCADFDLWFRILHFYPAVILPDYLAVYQRHPAQRTQNLPQLWIDSLCSVVNNCKAEPKYAQAFTVSEAAFKEFRKSMDLLWNASAGGEEGLQTAKRIARELLNEGDWSEHLRAQARAVLKKPGAKMSVEKLRETVQLRTRLRQASKNLRSSSREADRQQIATVNWWQNDARNP